MFSPVRCQLIFFCHVIKQIVRKRDANDHLFPFPPVAGETPALSRTWLISEYINCRLLSLSLSLSIVVSDRFLTRDTAEEGVD